jgi:hypothetical protein
LGDGFDRMRSRLNHLWDRAFYRRSGVEVTITAAGFKLEPNGNVTPYFAAISNRLRDGNWLDAPSTRFDWDSQAVPTGTAVIASPLGWVDAERRDRLLRDAVSTSTLDSAIGLVADAIREVAARDSAVGPDLQVAVLPKSSVRDDPSTLLTGGAPGDGSPTFHYLPVDGEPVVYGPTYVCRGSSMSGMKVTYGPPETPGP